MMPFNSNPVLQLVSMARSGGNPMAMLQQMAGSDPRIGQFWGMINGKSAQQLRQMAENVAKERGLDMNEVARSLGMTLPEK